MRYGINSQAGTEDVFSMWWFVFLYDKAPSDAITAFLVRPGRFFGGVIKARKTAPEKRLSGYVMRHFVIRFVVAVMGKTTLGCWGHFLPSATSHN